MVPNEFRKTLCLLAGFVTLVEAVLWGAAAIYSIGVFYCTWPFVGVEQRVSTWTLLYVTYFMGECSQEEAEKLGFSLTPPSNPAQCLLVWMWIYAIVSIVWIPACLLLIGGVLGEVKGRKGALLYYPWTSLVLVLTILDFAAALYHLVDVFQTVNADDYAKFTASKTWDTFIKQPVKSDDFSTWLPSFSLTLFYCRLIVVWILNIFFFYSVSKASIAVSQYETEYIQGKNGSDQIEPQNQSTTITTSQQTHKTEESKLRSLAEEQRSRELIREDSGVGRQNHPLTRYRTDQLGTPIEEEDMSEHKGTVYVESREEWPKKAGSPYLSARFDYTSRPATPDSFGGGERRHEGPPPPLASGIKIPPDLNKIGSFSYTAGDQPQLLSRTNLSRTNSRAEGQYPHIPRPDYTIADRRTASLEYVPNRFKIPAPKRPQSIHSALTYDAQTTTSHKVAPVPPKKPQAYLRSTLSAEDPRNSPRMRYIPQQPPPSQQVFYTSQSNNYNINKLY